MLTEESVAVPSSPRIHLRVKNGTVVVGSDMHAWPGKLSTATRAFIKFAKDLRPKAVILNGDVVDGARVSRHPPIGWESRPQLYEELAAAQSILGKIIKASPGARHIWPAGNHDLRPETRLATVAPEFAKIPGVHLKDHFPDWEACWSCWINDSVVVKHREKGGVHATHNNTVAAGKTIVTGHLHGLKVTPFTDYDGTRWGVDCGTLADVYGQQFADYTEDGPRSHRSGFIVLTFQNYELRWPEIVYVVKPNRVEFRGKIYRV